MPGVIAPGTLANLASKKQGPPCISKHGKAIYEKDSFLDWLADWLGSGEKIVPTNTPSIK